MLGHDQRLLVPKSEEKRCAPWLDLASDAPVGGGALRVGGAGSGAAGAGSRSERVAPPPFFDDILRNSSRSRQLALSAATCAHSISAQFLASRRCAFISPSR
jgi:hypothetical protein